jgi:flavorubredoxin
MSRFEAQHGLVICYGSMYGNTLRMAELIAEAASEEGLHTIRMHDVSRTHHSYILADIFRHRGLIVGAPTYNGQLFPDMENLLREISSRGIRHRLFGYFGSFTWAGQAIKQIALLTQGLQWESVTTPIEMKQGDIPSVEKECRTLGRKMAQLLMNPINQTSATYHQG